MGDTYGSLTITYINFYANYYEQDVVDSSLPIIVQVDWNRFTKFFRIGIGYCSIRLSLLLSRFSIFIGSLLISLFSGLYISLYLAGG